MGSTHESEGSLQYLLNSRRGYLTGPAAVYVSWLRYELDILSLEDLVEAIDECFDALVKGGGGVGVKAGLEGAFRRFVLRSAEKKGAEDASVTIDKAKSEKGNVGGGHGNRGREKGQNIALGAPSEGEGNGNGIEVPQRGNHRILPSDEEHYSLVNQRKMEEQAKQRRIEQEELNKVRLKQEREWEEMKRQLT